MKDRGAERAKEVLVRKAREHKTSSSSLSRSAVGNCQSPLPIVCVQYRPAGPVCCHSVR